MSVLLNLQDLEHQQRLSSHRPLRHSPGLLSHLLPIVLTVFVLAVHGYHPYAEDGGLYVAGIKRLLNPALYPAYTPFVTEHLRFSLFAPLVAALVRATSIPLPWTLVFLYAFSAWLTLFAAARLAARLTSSPAGRAAAVTLLACWFTLPIAGTALILFDPYLTARSLSTPLALLALTAALDFFHSSTRRPRNLLLCATFLLLATLLHPLMAGYALISILFLAAASQPTQTRRLTGFAALTLAAILTACTLQLLAPPESPAYLQVALTRYYWFPFWWHWYEQLGLIAPILVLLALHRTSPASPTRLTLTRAAIAIALAAIILALCFSRAHLATLLVARLQPLRIFQTVYELMILLLGARLGETFLRTHKLRWTLSVATLTAIMFYTQRRTFPASPHLELPAQQLPTPHPQNPWIEAFLWARQNTPTTAVFALDAHYITISGEDAQSFRAIAERSALPDYSKDGGEASIAPGLTPSWTTASRATLNLDTQSDATRLATLKPLGATWLLLQSSTPTQLPCPHTNHTLKLCRLP